MAAAEAVPGGHADTLASLRSGPAASILRDAISAHMKDAILQSATVKAIVKASLAGAHALSGLKLGITGAQKLELIQSLVKDAVEALDVPAEVKATLLEAIETAVPMAIDGLLYAMKAAPAAAAATAAATALEPAAPAVAALIGCCLPLLAKKAS